LAEQILAVHRPTLLPATHLQHPTALPHECRVADLTQVFLALERLVRTCIRFRTITSNIDVLALVMLCTAAAFSTDVLIRSSMNADSTLPISYAINLEHNPTTMSSFQLARVPSIFPDMIIGALLYYLTRSSNWTVLLYGFLQFAVYISLGGRICSILCNRSFREASLNFLLINSLVLAVALNFYGEAANGKPPVVFPLFSPMYGVFVMMSHWGPLLTSLIVPAFLQNANNRLAVIRILIIVLLGALVEFSDKLLFVEETLPLICVSVWAFLQRAQNSRVILYSGPATLVGLGLGWFILIFMMNDGIPIGSPPPISFQSVQTSILTFADDLTTFKVLGLPMTLLSFGSVGATVIFPLHVSRRSMPLAVKSASYHVWLFGAVAVALSLGVTSTLYIDRSASRYLAVVVCWGTIFFTSYATDKVSRTSWRLIRHGFLFIWSSSAMLIAYRPNVLVWHEPIVDCILETRKTTQLRDGLAEYWFARPAMLGLEWKMQIDQITSEGYGYWWANDKFWFTHSISDLSARPDYNFIVVDNMLRSDIIDKFGRPNLTVHCPVNEIWVYDSISLPIKLKSD
jgi:hypothetical protein